MTGTPLTAEGHPGPQAGQGLEGDLVLLVPGPPTPCRQMPPHTETGPTRGGHPASRSSAPPPQRSSSPSDGRPRRAPGGPPHSPSPGPQAWHPPGPAPRVASLAPRVSAHIHSGPGPPEPRAYDGPFPPTSLPSLPAAPPSAGPSPGSPHFPSASQDSLHKWGTQRSQCAGHPSWQGGDPWGSSTGQTPSFLIHGLHPEGLAGKVLQTKAATRLPGCRGVVTGTGGLRQLRGGTWSSAWAPGPRHLHASPPSRHQVAGHLQCPGPLASTWQARCTGLASPPASAPPTPMGHPPPG